MWQKKMEETKSDIKKNKIMLIHPPGKLFQRGEDRCQINIEATVSQSLHACNDLGYAASVLLLENYEVKLHDYQGEKRNEKELFSDLKEFEPDMLVISITDSTIYQDIELIKKIKQIFNPIIVLKGAIFWEYNKDFIAELDLQNVDFLIGVELECSIGKLANYALRSNEKIENIPNLFYKDSQGNFIPNKFSCWEKNIDKIPFPARHLMDNELYLRPDTGETMATIQTSRGCTGNCIYCLVPVLSGTKVRFRSPENVFEEIKECYEEFNIKNFFFRSDSFTIDANWVKKLCDLIIGSNLFGKIEFTANSRVFPLQKETLELMKKAGCFLVAFGLESGSEDTMKKIHKGATVEHNRQAITWAKEVGLQIFGMFVIGFPWETKEHILQTKNFIHETKPDFVEINLALPFPGTKLYDLCKDTPNFNNNRFGMDFFNPKIQINQNFTCEELIKLRKNMLLSYYLKPGYIYKKLYSLLAKKKYKVLKNYIKYGINMLKKLH